MFFFLPYKIERKSNSLPWVTITLIALNCLVYAGTMFDAEQVIQSFGFRANLWGLVTWLPAMFLHAGLLHLLGNMYFLWLFGSMVEDAIGPWRYTALYFMGGAAATTLHAAFVLAFTPDEVWRVAIGASGAVAAVIGIVAVRMYKAKMSVAYFILIWLFPKWGVWKMTALVGVGLYLAQELAYGAIGFVADDGTAHWAHVGGLIAGVVLGLSWGSVKEAAREYLAEEAEEYALTGANDIAAAKYDELAQDDPNNPDWLVQKVQAGVMVAGADSTELATDFDRAVDLLYRAGRKQEIVDTYRLLGEGPHFKLSLGAHTLQIVGSMAEAMRDYTLADTAYRDLVRSHPASKEAERALFRLAHVFLARGMTPQARQTWQVFAKRYPSSEWHEYADIAFAGIERAG